MSRENVEKESVAGATQSAPAAEKQPVTLDQLAEQIRAEHEAAEDEMRGSLMHAKRAGELLIEAKNQLEHGKFLPWVDEHCKFSQSTANLYMKIARDWEKLNSQRVGILSLRRATELLVAAGAEEDEQLDQDKQALFDLAILEPADLEGLSVREVRALVTEVRQAEEHDGYEHWQEKLGRLKQENPARAQVVEDEARRLGRMFVDRNFLRSVARGTATKLREGKINVTQIYDRVRVDFCLPPIKERRGPPGVVRTWIPRLTCITGDSAFEQSASRFYTETMTLAGEIENAGKRLSETDGEPDNIRRVCRQVREALGAVQPIRERLCQQVRDAMNRLEQSASQAVERQRQNRTTIKGEAPA